MSKAPRTPIRRPQRLRGDLDVLASLEAGLRFAPEIEAGWSALLAELAEVGWPARIPEGDRKPASGAPEGDGDTPPPDYADPAGELAIRLDNLHFDREALEDHRRLVVHSLAAMRRIAVKHLPPSAPSIPGCTVAGCDEPVESRAVSGGGRSYVGMVQIAGTWFIKPGSGDPVCAAHRKQRERKVS